MGSLFLIDFFTRNIYNFCRNFRKAVRCIEVKMLTFSPARFTARRGEAEIGKRAVASVILNRYKSGKWFAGNTIAETCQFCVKGSKYHQFSCWNEDDPNFDLINRISESDKAFCECIDVAEKYVAGVYKDIVCGACHYCVDGVHPAWAKGRNPDLQIGRHLFYCGVE